MHARLDSGSRLTSRALLAPSPGAGCREVCSLIASKRVSRIAAKGTVAKAPARSANTRIGCRPYKERLHSWNQCTVCGHADGILVCEACQGQGIVATKPGGAGVPFYIGNAQCSTCKGMGFEPCSVCIGYQAELPPPDPCNGPASRDPSDSRVTTMRWLQSFPDSRSTGRSSRTPRRKGVGDHRAEAPVEQQSEACASQAERAKWEVLAKQFYVMHGAKRSRC